MDKIVILDALTLGNADLSQLQKFGKLIKYDWTKPEETPQRIADADIVITNKVVIGEKELKSAKKLQLICVAATGYNNIDTKATSNKNIVVANVKDYSTESVAQYVFAHLLAVKNSIFQYQSYVKNGKWTQSKVFTSLDFNIDELKGKNFGIIGYGKIGKRVGQLAKAFGMNLLIAKRPNTHYTDNFRTSFETVLRESDVLSIHTPLTKETKNLIGLEELKKMKKSAVLINAARGGIVNEKALFEALKKQYIAYAIVDVLTLEPPTEGNILFSAPNILITPHIAWTSIQARQKLIEGIISNIEKFKQGKTDEIAVY